MIHEGRCFQRPSLQSLTPKADSPTPKAESPLSSLWTCTSCQISSGISSEIKYAVNIICLNHSETILSPAPHPSPPALVCSKNHLPWNWHLVPKMLETIGLKDENRPKWSLQLWYTSDCYAPLVTPFWMGTSMAIILHHPLALCHVCYRGNNLFMSQVFRLAEPYLTSCLQKAKPMEPHLYPGLTWTYFG